MRYSFLDENDEPTFAHDQYGREIWGGHWSPNLVTNAGLNAVATDRLRSYPHAITTEPQTWRRFGRIGTGSTAPDFTDSTLVSEVMATDDNGGFGDSNSYPDPDGGFITANLRITRLFTLSDAQNLTEYGFSTTVDGSLNIRELFRDEHGDPVTISVAAGKKIRIDHTLEYSLPWGVDSATFDIEEYDANDALVTTHSITADCLWVAVGAGDRVKMFYAALPYRGGNIATKRFSVYGSAPSTDPTTSAAISGDLNTSTGEYAPGSHEVREYAVIPEPSLNGDSYGYVFRILATTGAGDGSRQGFRVAFNTPATFTKANTHTLELAMILSWARG